MKVFMLLYLVSMQAILISAQVTQGECNQVDTIPKSASRWWKSHETLTSKPLKVYIDGDTTKSITFESASTAFKGNKKSLARSLGVKLEKDQMLTINEFVNSYTFQMSPSYITVILPCDDGTEKKLVYLMDHKFPQTDGQRTCSIKIKEAYRRFRVEATISP